MLLLFANPAKDCLVSTSSVLGVLLMVITYLFSYTVLGEGAYMDHKQLSKQEVPVSTYPHGRCFAGTNIHSLGVGGNLAMEMAGK